MKEITLVPQAAMNSLNPVLRIRDQILDALVAHDIALTKQEQNQLVNNAMSRVGLPVSAANRFPHQLPINSAVE